MRFILLFVTVIGLVVVESFPLDDDRVFEDGEANGIEFYKNEEDLASLIRNRRQLPFMVPALPPPPKLTGNLGRDATALSGRINYDVNKWGGSVMGTHDYRLPDNRFGVEARYRPNKNTDLFINAAHSRTYIPTIPKNFIGFGVSRRF